MSSFAPGGTERQMIELIRRLDRRRWDVHVACLRSGGAWTSRVAEAAPVTQFPLKSFRHPDTLAQMHAFGHWCRERGILVLQTTDLPSNIFGLAAAAFAQVPVRIGSRRDVTPGRSVPETACQRAAYACAHRIVANCRAAAHQLETERVPSRKIRVIYNGVDRQRAAPVARCAPLRRLVTVANLRPEKGHDVLLGAATDVLDFFPDATLELVGDGSQRARLEAAAAALGIGNSIAFSGHCDDVTARLDAADIFVLPSRSEAFPNALLEAMTAGLPIVASRVGGVLEVVRDGETGLLVPPDDPGALGAAIRRLIADPALAGRLGAAARADVTARYSFNRMVAAFDSLYLTELSRRGHARVPQSELAAS